MSKNIVRANNLKKSFITEAGEQVVLKNINLSIKKGELFGVFGRSGSGKSTLMNLFTGIDRPTDGEIFIGDEPIHTYNESQLASWRGNKIGIVFQFFQLLPMLTVLENVVLPMEFCNKYHKRDRKNKALALLDKLGIAELACKFPTAISGGQQQRVAIARALANEPDIIVADEPTGNLDSKTSKDIFDVFKEQARNGKTVIIVTHDPGLKAEFTRGIELCDGEIASGM